MITDRHDGGTIRRKFSVDDEGRYHGTYTRYWSTGNPVEILNYKHGVLHGEFIEFYANSSVREQGTYVNGKEQGVTIEYYQSGGVKKIRNFTNGEEDGKIMSFFEDGSTKCIGFVRSYKFRGEYITFYNKSNVPHYHAIYEGDDHVPAENYIQDRMNIQDEEEVTLALMFGEYILTRNEREGKKLCLEKYENITTQVN